MTKAADSLRRTGWLRGTVTAIAVVAVLGCAVAFLGTQAFAGAPAQGEDVVLEAPPLVEPPAGAVPRTATAGQPVQGEALLENWRYTKGSFH
jgi:hypothetical protein